MFDLPLAPLREIHVRPAREAVGRIPRALAVAHEAHDGVRAVDVMRDGHVAQQAAQHGERDGHDTASVLGAGRGR